MSLSPCSIRYNRHARSASMSLGAVRRSWVRMSEMMNLAPCRDAATVNLAPCR
jgi:hypothetical protein